MTARYVCIDCSAEAIKAERKRPINITIFVHSLTGNTLSVAQLLCKRFADLAHEATIVHLAPIGGEDTKVTDLSKIQLQTFPHPDQFDFLVFAGPVYGFSMTPVMSKFFSLIPTLSGKRVACFVTQKLSKPFLGGNRTIAQYEKQCVSLGATVVATGIVNWGNKARDQMIADVVETICRAASIN